MGILEFINKIPPAVCLIFSLILITTGIVILFLGNFVFAILALIMGIIALVTWTFL